MDPLEESIMDNILPLGSERIKQEEESKGYNFLGLNFVLEIQKKGGNSFKTCSYFCSICMRTVAANSLISHLSCHQHNIQYMKIVFPSIHVMIIAEPRSSQNGYLMRLNGMIKNIVGPTSIVVAPMDEVEKIKEDLVTKISNISEHISYYDGIEAENLELLCITNEEINDETETSISEDVSMSNEENQHDISNELCQDIEIKELGNEEIGLIQDELAKTPATKDSFKEGSPENVIEINGKLHEKEIVVESQQTDDDGEQSLDPENKSLDPESQLLDPENKLLDPENQSLDPDNKSLDPVNQLLDPENESFDPENESLDSENESNPETELISQYLENNTSDFEDDLENEMVNKFISENNLDYEDDDEERAKLSKKSSENDIILTEDLKKNTSDFVDDLNEKSNKNNESEIKICADDDCNKKNKLKDEENSNNNQKNPSKKLKENSKSEIKLGFDADCNEKSKLSERENSNDDEEKNSDEIDQNKNEIIGWDKLYGSPLPLDRPKPLWMSAKVLIIRNSKFRTSRFWQKELNLPNVTYINFPHDDLFPGVFEGLLKEENKNVLRNFDILILSPFDLIVPFYGPKQMSTQMVKHNSDVKNKILTAINYIENLQEHFNICFPKLSIIWTLPHPTNYCQKAKSKRGKSQQSISRKQRRFQTWVSVNQYCRIYSLLKYWLNSMMPYPVISLIDFVVSPENHESFVNGRGQLRWKEEIKFEYSLKLRTEIWAEIKRLWEADADSIFNENQKKFNEIDDGIFDKRGFSRSDIRFTHFLKARKRVLEKDGIISKFGMYGFRVEFLFDLKKEQGTDKRLVPQKTAKRERDDSDNREDNLHTKKSKNSSKVSVDKQEARPEFDSRGKHSISREKKPSSFRHTNKTSGREDVWKRLGAKSDNSAKYGSSIPGSSNLSNSNQRSGNFGHSSRRSGSFANPNQNPGIFGNSNQRPGNFGNLNQIPGNFGNLNQGHGNFGNSNQGPQIFVNPNQGPTNFGYANQEPKNFGNSNQVPENFGNPNLATGNFSNLSQVPRSFNNSNQGIVNFCNMNQGNGFFGNPDPIPENVGNPNYGPRNFNHLNQDPGNFGNSNKILGNFGNPNQGPGNFGNTNQGPGNFGNPYQGPGNLSNANQGHGNFGSPNQGPGNLDNASRGPGNFGSSNQEPEIFFTPNRGRGEFENPNKRPGNFSNPHHKHRSSGNSNQGPRDFSKLSKGRRNLDNINQKTQNSEYNLVKFSPLHTLNIMCEAKEYLGFLAAQLMSLRDRCADFEARNIDSMVLFSQGDNVDIIPICMEKFRRAISKGLDKFDQLMAEAALKSCTKLFAQIKTNSKK